MPDYFSPSCRLPIRQRVVRLTPSSRAISCLVLPGGEGGGTGGGQAAGTLAGAMEKLCSSLRSSTVTSAASDRTTSRSQMFRSSRTLPGQA